VGLAIGLVVVALAALMQVSAVPQFSIFGVAPNLVVVTLVAWAIVRPRNESLFLVPFGGVALGTLDGEPLGLAVLALAPLILLADIPHMHLIDSDLLPAVVVVTLATLSYEIAILLTLAVKGEQIGLVSGLLDVLVPAVIVNVLLLLPVYGLVRLSSLDMRRQRAF
jgi:rod shape-determining protein MreD